jgi:hypothetical protein
MYQDVLIQIIFTQQNTCQVEDGLEKDKPLSTTFLTMCSFLLTEYVE